MFHLQKIKVKGILTIDELTFATQKFSCIVGSSGSGKSTLLRLLNNLSSPDEGEIIYKGKNLKGIDSIQLRREVVMLQQEPVTFEGTIKDNLTKGLYFSEKEPISEQRLLELLHMFQLRHDLDKEAMNLSGGEKQRLALARVLIMQPEVLLLDEPTSSLDEETEEHVIKQLIEYVKKINGTVIMVTHSKHIVEMVADEVIDLAGYNIITEEGKG